MANDTKATAVATENIATEVATTATEVATIVEDTLVLKGINDCKKIICISNNNLFKNGKRGEDKKTYSLFRIGKTAFTVPDDNPFVADHKAGNLYEVCLNRGTAPKKEIDEDGNEVVTQVPSLEFDYHLTQDQEVSADEFELKKSQIQFKRDSFKKLSSSPITDDFLATLLSNAI